MFLKIFAILHLFLNHIINIPINFLLGTGKVFAFTFAFLLDILQIKLYFYILEKNKIETKLRNFITEHLSDENKIKNSLFFKRMQRFRYFGIFILATMPIYAGGIWPAVIMSSVLSLDRKKSYFFLIMGSLIGCSIWVLGIIYIINVIKVNVFE